ncbi:MAG: response regulator [Myxococcales bacterium]|nr:response regulator [Myxococcales bacterium]
MTPSFTAYLQGHNAAAVRLTCILCAALMPAGVTLDLLTNREKVWEFLGLRLIAAAVSLLVLALSRLQALRRHSYLLIVAVILACTGSMEIMILRLGQAASSPYYAGLNLCILGAGLVYVWSGMQTLWVCLAVMAMWLIPALLARPSLYGSFFNNLYFLVLTSIIAVAANSMRYNLAKREWEARTALDQASFELKQALERLRELDRLKNQFFANISHELRTPLALIRAPIEELIARANLPDSVDNTLQVVLRNALRLHRLIDGLLDLARLEAGQLHLRVSAIELPQLIKNIVAAFQPAIESLGLTLDLKLPETPVSEVVLGDSEKLEVVLTNLLGNAAKFTERGGHIEVRLRELPEKHAVEIDVIDDGPGIPLSDQPHVFERFRRVESPGRKQGGAGIGLALVKELVELHGGTVSVDSAPGAGACFTVRLKTGSEHLHARNNAESSGDSASADTRLPVSVNPALAHVTHGIDPRLEASGRTSSQTLGMLLPSNMTDQGRAHIVLAEDNADMRAFLSELLAPYYNVTTVTDGKSALTAIQSQLPDVVLADVMMPHLSGIELCRELKSDQRTRTIPVILLTARSGIDETMEGFSSGAADYLVKPFSPRELLVRVSVQLKVRRLTAQVANAARLSAVGTLAAGVAHEIKNPLNAISTGAAALRKRNELTPTLYGEVLDMIDECVQRIAEITTALTDHARPADGEGVSVFDLRHGLESTLKLLSDRLRHNSLHVVRRYDTERLVLVRPRQLNQVFLNLLDNAMRASPSGGNIYLSLSDTGRGTIRLTVGDDGPGVPPESRERIFDPFFTTRAPGEGTGLGLYLSRQIIEAHGGALRVGSSESGGAEFTVELPLPSADETRNLPSTLSGPGHLRHEQGAVA